MPSTGIEPVTFPMSRERATAAPTGLKFTQIVFVGAFPLAGTNFVLQALRQLGLNYTQIVLVGAFPLAGTNFVLQALHQLA